MRQHSATPSIVVALIAMSGCSSALAHSSDLAPFDVITVAPAHDGSSANRVSVAIDVRFLAASSARGQFGPGCHCDAGVILVATRKANQER